jgi:hypothetical protein
MGYVKKQTTLRDRIGVKLIFNPGLTRIIKKDATPVLENRKMASFNKSTAENYNSLILIFLNQTG